MTDKQIIYVPNINREGKVEFESNFGLIRLGVHKLKGASLFEVFIEGKYVGVNFLFAEKAWEWIGDYLGCKVYETPKKQPKPVRAPRKRKVYK